ncbi:unsaturated rhamnogalacturonyl hydrolase [Saonia flava]|uniref:Unsaturated rhamnogalacturonyl hydrolase n=1 Tax=Saonia flava TaxID=523696 RepID=A0A846QUW6_9FLAO|nr:glycoside hydrolase family 88 protein [Saonia flava]NJB71818.1 unsaturated rhamnogalacturonyl hydrolase [Saonia flava]
MANILKRGFSILFIFSLYMFYITACRQIKKENANISDEMPLTVSDTIPWSERMALSIMKRNPEIWQTENDSIPKWNYKIGLLCTSFQKLYEKTGNAKYLDYVKNYTNKIVDRDGNIAGYNKEEYNIDMVNSGKMLFWLYDETKEDRYLNALITLREQLEGHPRTNSDGLWHKKIYPHQMWLDGLYMGAPFYAEFNSRFENEDKLNDIAHQFELIWKKTYDGNTGLLLHAWDESKKMRWADKQTGKSPNFWSRSLGWYMMALVDVLDFFPKDHPKRKVLIQQLNDLSKALVEFQDESGVWFQVTNLPDREGNYLESSGSCMFAYAFAKGTKKGYLSKNFNMVAELTFSAILKEFIQVDQDGEIHINKVCKSAGLGGNPYRDGTFEYYISEPIVTDNLHGLGPFILAANQLNK